VCELVAWAVVARWLAGSPSLWITRKTRDYNDWTRRNLALNLYSKIISLIRGIVTITTDAGSINTNIVPANPRYLFSCLASTKFNVCAESDSNLFGQNWLTVSNQFWVQSVRLPAESSKIFQDIPVSSNLVLISDGDPVIWVDVVSRSWIARRSIRSLSARDSE